MARRSGCPDCMDGLLFPRDECPTCRLALPPSPRAVGEFRRKLASSQWQQLVANARQNLGILDTSQGGMTTAGLVAALMDMLFQAQDVASGRSNTFSYPDPLLFAVWFVELCRASAALASYLGTTSRGDIAGFLIMDWPIQPERLQTGRAGKALADFAVLLYQLLGMPLDDAAKVGKKTTNRRDDYLRLFVEIARGKFGRDWDATRVAWNRTYPHWAYDSTETFRKAYRDAVNRQPGPDS